MTDPAPTAPESSPQPAVYLNQAGTSWPKPPPVVSAASAALSLDPGRWPAALAEQQAIIARWLGLPDAQRLRFTPGATSALAAGIASIEFDPGERVLTSAMEHEAVAAPVRALALRGIPRVIVPRAEAGPIDLHILERELTHGDVRLVAVSAAASVTGERLPFEHIIELCHEYGALCLLDASQLLGWERLDLPLLDADLVAFAGHKALHGTWGIGGLYVAEPLPLPSWCELGSYDRAALAALAAAVTWLEEPAQSGRLARGGQLADRCADALSRLPGLTVHGRDGGWRLPTLAFTVPDHRPADLADALRARGVLVSGGHQCAPEAHQALGTAPDGAVRVSFGPSNTEDDLAALVAAVTDLV